MTSSKITTVFFIALAILSAGCSSTSATKKIVIDSSPVRPDWIDRPDMYWETKDGYCYKSTVTIRGDERVNGGYIIASNDNRERLIRDISDKIKGRLQEAQMSLSQNAEFVLNKVRTGDFEGKIYGLRDTEQYFERYEYVNESTKERVTMSDCCVLSCIDTADYAKTRQALIYQIIEIDPRVKEAMTQGLNKFLDDESGVSQAQGNN